MNINKKLNQFTQIDNIISFFTLIKTSNKQILQNLCNELCNGITLKYILSTIAEDRHKSLPSIRIDQLFIDFYNLEKNYHFCESITSEINEHEVVFANHGILSFPWKKDSFLLMFEKFNDESFVWKQDINHIITLIKPFNIYFVHNGNHSIACAKFLNKGKIICNKAIDYTNIIKEYTYDGNNFINRNGKKINKPRLYELGQLFLLGKAILDNGDTNT